MKSFPHPPSLLLPYSRLFSPFSHCPLPPYTIPCFAFLLSSFFSDGMLYFEARRINFPFLVLLFLFSFPFFFSPFAVPLFGSLLSFVLIYRAHIICQDMIFSFPAQASLKALRVIDPPPFLQTSYFPHVYASPSHVGMSLVPGPN